MTRYYCSGFDINNAFGYGLGEMFRNELKDTKRIVYIPAGEEKIQKAKEIYIPEFTEYFKKVEIEFEENILITTEMSRDDAKKTVREASFVMLMGGDPFKQKEFCAKMDLLDELKEYNGVMLGFSAGAMFMSKFIIVTPCSDEYPDFQVEEGLNLDGVSIYPHNNTSDEEYPDTLVSGDEVYKKEDLITVANQYGDYYLLQDNWRDDGLVDVSIIKSNNGNLEFYTENSGKIWLATSLGVKLVNSTEKVNV